MFTNQKQTWRQETGCQQLGETLAMSSWKTSHDVPGLARVSQAGQNILLEKKNSPGKLFATNVSILFHFSIMHFCLEWYVTFLHKKHEITLAKVHVEIKCKNYYL